MLITDLFYELKNHKIKISILFIILTVLSGMIIKFSQTQYIKQKIFIDIKAEVDFFVTSDPGDTKLQFNTGDQFTVTKSENKFLSPAYENYSLGLNTNTFYLNLLDDEIVDRITSDYRPGYELLVFYNRNEKRYEITIQLFDDETLFDIALGQIKNGIIDYFNQKEFKDGFDNYFTNAKNDFDFVKKNIVFYKNQYEIRINNIQKIIKNAKSDLETDIYNTNLYEKYKLIMFIENKKSDLARAQRQLKNLERLYYEFNLKENEYKSHFDIDKFYSISLSDRKIIMRGKYPEYVIVLFLALFVSISLLISYFSLIRRN